MAERRLGAKQPIRHGLCHLEARFGAGGKAQLGLEERLDEHTDFLVEIRRPHEAVTDLLQSLGAPRIDLPIEPQVMIRTSMDVATEVHDERDNAVAKHG